MSHITAAEGEQLDSQQVHAYWREPDATNDTRSYTRNGIGRSFFLVKQMRRHVVSHARILELGCNAGRNLAFLHHAGFTQLAGVEISQEAVDHLRESFPELAEVKITVASIESVIRDIPDNAYDIVFTMACLEHVHWDSEWIFREMVRIAPKVMLIEDEVTESPRHFRRNYEEVFTALDMSQVDFIDRVPGLPAMFRYRLFERRERAGTLPAKVIVAGTQGPLLRQVSKLLHHLDSASFTNALTFPENPSDVDEIAAELDSDDENSVMLFIENLETIVARELKQGKGPDEAANKWCRRAKRLLAFAEQYPAQIRVFVANDVVSSPEAFAAHLSDQFKCLISFSGTPRKALKDKWDDLYLMVASEYIRQRRTLLKSAGTLQQRRDFRPKIATTRVDWARVVQDVTTVQRENRILFEQLHKIQIELETRRVQAADRQEANKTLNADVQRLMQEVNRLNTVLKGLESSKSWRITAPLRTSIHLAKGLMKRG